MEGGIPRGTQVGSYVIDSFLGRGGMGVVYKAYHPRLDRWAAIKLLPPFHSSGDARDRFEREARAVARLRHRHILSVFDFGEFAGQPYMVVELMPNGSLDERMPKAPLTPAQALALLRPLGDALDYAHQQGVLHRDVKPANVFLDSEFQPVLADFGLAKMAGDQSLTASGMISGTPTHISPEQTQGRQLDARSDLYSLAVIGYQLLAGRLPFEGLGMMDLLYAHVNTEPPPPSVGNPALPPAVDDVLVRALAKDPAARFESAAQMMGALEAAAAGRPDERKAGPRAVVPVAVPLGPAEPAAAGAVLAPAVEDVAAPSTPRTRNRGPAIAAVAVVVLLLAGAGYALLPRSSAPGAGTGPTPAATQPGTSPSASAGTAVRVVEVSPASPLRMGNPISVSGRGLDPRRDANAGVLQGGVVHPISGSLPVQPDGSFAVDGNVPTDLSPGPAALIACNFDAQHRTDLGQCIQLNVSVVR